MKKKYGVALLLLALLLLFVFGQGGSRLQVQLRANYADGRSLRINAASQATISHLNGGGNEKKVRFRDGILKMSFPYGITTVNGYFELEDIQKIWPNAPLSHNWSFSFWCLIPALSAPKTYA